MNLLQTTLKGIYTSRKSIITHLNALTCMYMRQAGHMTHEADTLKRTVKLIKQQCQYLLKNIEWEEMQRRLENEKQEALSNYKH